MMGFQQNEIVRYRMEIDRECVSQQSIHLSDQPADRLEIDRVDEIKSGGK